MAKARRRACPTSSPRRTSFAHLVTGAASATRSPESHGSVIRWRVSCCPAVTTSGVSLAFEATSTPMALPSPPIACRLTKPVAPRDQRPAVRHADRGRLLQAEHILDVGRVDERVHQRHLGRAGIAEDVRDPLVAKDVEQNVAGASGHWRLQLRMSRFENRHRDERSNTEHQIAPIRRPQDMPHRQDLRSSPEVFAALARRRLRQFLRQRRERGAPRAKPLLHVSRRSRRAPRPPARMFPIQCHLFNYRANASAKIALS